MLGGHSEQTGDRNNDAAAWRPSSDLRQLAGGIASGDGSNELKQVSTSPDGRVTLVTRFSGDGTVQQETTIQENVPDQRHSDGSYTLAGEGATRIVDTQYADGTRQVVHYQRVGNGDWEEVGRDFRRMPTENESSPLAAYLAWRFGPRASAPAPEVTKVNPGDASDSGPAAPKLIPGESIVVNPAADSAQQSREVSEEMAAHVREKIGDIGTPGGDPGEPNL
jgi:hypothetical protein